MRNDEFWYASGSIPRVTVGGVYQFIPAGNDALGMQVPVLPGRQQHIAVCIVASRNGTFFPTAPLRYLFFGGTDLAFDPDDPIEPVAGQSFVYLTQIAGEPTYAYWYIVPVPSNGFLYTHALDNDSPNIPTASTVSLLGLAEVGESTATLVSDDTTLTVEAAVGLAGSNGLWLLAGMIAGESADVVWPATQLGGEPGDTYRDSGFILGDTGDVSGGSYDFTFTPPASSPGAMLGVWIQLLPVTTPDLIPVPATTVVTNVFEATTGTLGGTARSLPGAVVTNEFSASIALPTTGGWWAVLVDAEGQTVARMPEAVVGDIVETLNDITSASVKLPIRSRAGQLIDTQEVLPELEVQVWRGDVLWVWGPIVDAVPEGDHWRLDVRDARWHLTRRHVGELGGSFGGKPPYFHGEIVNERFQSGDLTGWSVFRTVSFGVYPGFGVPDPGAVTVDPSMRLPDGNPMVKGVSPLDPLDNYQLFQDVSIRGPQDGRPLHVTLSGWWWIPAGEFLANNQRMGLLLATLLDDASLPNDYYRPTDWEFTLLDESVERETLVYQECTLELPPGVETLVHVAVCFPQGTAWVGGLEVTVDDGLLYDESPSTIGPGLLMHAQDPYFDKSDVNLGWTANTVGDRLSRGYVFRDHTNIAQAITSLAGEGWFDWDMAYSTETRCANFTAPKRGGYLPSCRIRMSEDGRGNVDRVTRQRMWQSGSTVVAAQTRSNGSHERAARSDHALTLEEVFVAPREPRDYDLAGLASEHLAPAVDAAVIEVQTVSGDTRFLLGIQPGDTTDVLSSLPGHYASGRHRLARRTINAERDSATLELNPC